RELATTMIYVTHDQVEAMTMGDRVAVLRDGVLQQVAAPRDLYRDPVNAFVAGFIGSPAMNLVDVRWPTAPSAARDSASRSRRVGRSGSPWAPGRSTSGWCPTTASR